MPAHKLVNWLMATASRMRDLIMAGQQRVYDIVLHMQCHFLSVLIRIHVIHPEFQTPQLVQLMNIVSNLIFHCNNCDASRALVTIRESTTVAPSSGAGKLNAIFTFKGTSPTNHFCTDSWGNKCPTTLSLTVFT